jgi:hypothetical protein
MKNYTIYIGLLAALILTGAGCVTTPSNTPASTPSSTTNTTTSIAPTQETVQLPENKFDTMVNIPGTKLVLAYPAKGFYQLGARVNTHQPSDSNLGDVLNISPEQPYNAARGSEFVILAVSVRNPGAAEKTLKDVIAGLDPNTIETSYAKENGNYRTINGQEFFMYKVTEDSTLQKAMILKNNQIITISLTYKLIEGAQSETAYRNNDKLFLEILEHISSK